MAARHLRVSTWRFHSFAMSLQQIVLVELKLFQLFRLPQLFNRGRVVCLLFKIRHYGEILLLEYSCCQFNVLWKLLVVASGGV